MKKLFFIWALSFCSLPIFAQQQDLNTLLPIDDETQLITYKEVVKETGNKKELYDRGMAWVKAYFVNAEEVTQSTDAEKCVIEGKHRLQVYNILDPKTGKKTKGPLVEYKFQLEFRDGRYRYTFNNFTNKDQASRFPVERWMNKKESLYNTNWDGYLVQINEKIEETIDKLKEGMHPKVEKADEW